MRPLQLMHCWRGVAYYSTATTHCRRHSAKKGVPIWEESLVISKPDTDPGLNPPFSRHQTSRQTLFSTNALPNATPPKPCALAQNPDLLGTQHAPNPNVMVEAERECAEIVTCRMGCAVWRPAWGDRNRRLGGGGGAIAEPRPGDAQSPAHFFVRLSYRPTHFPLRLDGQGRLGGNKMCRKSMRPHPDAQTFCKLQTNPS